MSYLYGGNLNVDEEEFDDNNDEERNDIPPEDLDPTFCKNVQKIKWDIYKNIILKPELQTSNAQNNNLLNDYLTSIRGIYVLTLNAQKGKNKNINLNHFPEEVRGEIQELLDWIADFFKKNQIYQTIPYSHYLNNSFNEYPFIQRQSFNNDNNNETGTETFIGYE
jgi:hypothetical protein